MTALVAWFVVPGLRRRDIGTDVAGAALYVVNWVFAHRAVDYLASDSIPSPVQHFWSLAVEEQFYVVWPLALIALALVLKRLGRPPGVGVVAAPPRRDRRAVLRVCRVAGSRRPGPRVLRHHDAGVGARRGCGARGLVRRQGGGTRHTEAPEDADGGKAAVAWAVLGWVGLAAVIGSAVWLPAGATTPGPGRWSRRWGRRRCSRRLVGRPGRAGAGARHRADGVGRRTVLLDLPLALARRSSSTEWALDGITTTQRVLVLCRCRWCRRGLSHRFLESPIHHSRALAARTRPVLALGVALSAVGALAALPLVAAARRSAPRRWPAPDPRSTRSAPRPSRHRRAPTQRRMPSTTGAGSRLTRSSPARTAPPADVDRCQVDRLVEEPVACEFGVAEGRPRWPSSATPRRCSGCPRWSGWPPTAAGGS